MNLRQFNPDVAAGFALKDARQLELPRLPDLTGLFAGASAAGAVSAASDAVDWRAELRRIEERLPVAILGVAAFIVMLIALYVIIKQ